MNTDDATQQKFQSIARASILASIENKHTQYIATADRRAQGILAIAAFLIPIAISRIDSPGFFPAIAVFLTGAVITIVSATLCLFPKRFRRVEKNDRFPLHFSYISRQERGDYLQQMSEILEDTSQLALEVSRDLYHLSHDVLIPKFRWLRVAYSSFVLSLLLSLAMLVFSVLENGGP